jgi:hypothetical protein
VGKRGPKPTGDPRRPLTLNVRWALREDITDAAAKAEVTVAVWLRWALRMVLARGWQPRPGAAENGKD